MTALDCRLNVAQILNSQMIPFTLKSQVGYGVYFVNYLVKHV